MTEVTIGLCGELGPEVTVIVPVAVLVGSATLVAVTNAVPTVEGAVYTPLCVMVPVEQPQVTPLLLVVP